MAETPPRPTRTPEENLDELRGVLGTGREPMELAELAINAVGDLNVDPADTAAVGALNGQLDAVLALAGEAELGNAIRQKIDELIAADGSSGLTPDQQRQLAVIQALGNRGRALPAATSAATTAPGSGAASAAAAAWRRRGASAGSAGSASASSSPSASATTGSSASAAAHRLRTGAASPGPTSAPGTGPGPARANTVRDDYDTLTKRFKFLAERAQAANGQKGNGHERERPFSTDEAMLRDILRALDVDPSVELPITQDRSHPEQGMTESVEDSLEFIAEARELYLQLIGRPTNPAQPGPGPVFQYRGPKIGKSDVIRAEFVDRLGELTDFSRWIVDSTTQDGLEDTLRELFIGEKKRFLTDGRDGVRAGLVKGYEAAGTSQNEKGPRAATIVRVSRRGPGGAVSQDRRFPMWNLDSRLIVFHRAQIFKRMQLSNELQIAQRIGSLRFSMMRRGDDANDPMYPEILDRRMAPFIDRITDFADHIDGDYRDWLQHLYDGIDPRDGTLVGSPFAPVSPRGPGAHHGFDRYPAGVRLHHNVFPQVGATALGDTLVGSWGPIPPAQPGHAARRFVSPRRGASPAKPARHAARPGPGSSPAEQTKERLQKLYKDDLARRKAERREERSLRRRMKVAGFAGGVLLALPEPIQGRVAAAVQRGAAKRKGRPVSGQSHS